MPMPKPAMTEKEYEDTCHRAADEASARLRESATRLDESAKALDGSDVAAKRWETADRLHRRRQVEFKNLEAKFLDAQSRVSAKVRAANQVELAKILADADFISCRHQLDVIAKRAVRLAVDLQREYATARDLAKKQCAAVQRARNLGDELGEIVVASKVEEDEAMLLFAQRLAAHAQADCGVALETIDMREPEVLDREPRVNERLVPAPIEYVAASRMRVNQWRDLAEFFRTEQEKSE
jgi:hypothetical protein